MTPADILALQASLGVKQDGVLGPVTWSTLLAAVGAPLGPRSKMAAVMNDAFDRFALTTRLRVVHFLAQAGHESGGFRHFVELGGPTYCAKYDGRRDLGNVKDGDGYRYRGRGPFMLTGRANYREYGAQLGIDLEDAPDLAADPATGIRIACLYWHDHGCNALADADDLEGVTRKINGGLTNLADRADRLRELKAVWP